MKRLAVLQHTEAEYLGLMEDHFEGRNIRFQYFRPFASGGIVPPEVGNFDGLVVLGAGPYGVVSGHILPSLGPELRLVRAFLDAGLPVLGFGLGAVILAVAAGGGAEEAPLRFTIETAFPTGPDMAEVGTFPLACYLRDRFVLPSDATILCQSDAGTPLVFALRENAIGFLGHPGMKRGMAEDLIMEFAETPDETLLSLERLGAAQGAIAEALTGLMVTTIARCGWM
jgi:GMP synthase-like glutamine amidotransferase